MWIDGLKEAYRLFDCDSKITLDEAKSRYRSLAKKYHPDAYKGTDGAEMMKKINYAYEIIRENIGVKEIIAFRFEKDKKEPKKKKRNQLFYKNETAYIKRFIFKGGYKKDNYCWEPTYETYSDFSMSVSVAAREIINKVFEKHYKFPYKGGPTSFLSILCAKEQQILYTLLRSEFVKPYYCLCRLTEKFVKGKIEAKEFTNSMIGNEYKEYDEWNLFLSLRGTFYEGRTENIERCKEGEEVLLFGFGDNPIYPEKIEVFDLHYNSLGTIPAEYAVCITPLVQNGMLEIDGVIDSIMTRVMRSTGSKKATMTVKLTLRMKQKEFEDFPSSKKDDIEKIISSCDKKCSEIISAYLPHTVIGEYMIEHFSEYSMLNDKDDIVIPEGYTECIVDLKGTFGQFDRCEELKGGFKLEKSDGIEVFTPVNAEFWQNCVITLTNKDVYETVRNKLGDVFYCENENLIYMFDTSWIRDIEIVSLKVFERNSYEE